MRVYYFLLGMLEFRSSVTTNVSGNFIETYDKGRDFMHRITKRRYEGQS